MRFKQSYCDLSDYMNGPFAHSLEEAEYQKWADQATYMIDKLTYGRAEKHKDALASEEVVQVPPTTVILKAMLLRKVSLPLSTVCAMTHWRRPWVLTRMDCCMRG